MHASASLTSGVPPLDSWEPSAAMFPLCELLSVDTFGRHLRAPALMHVCVCVCDSSRAVPGTGLAVRLRARALVWSAAMWLGSRWRRGWQEEGLLSTTNQTVTDRAAGRARGQPPRSTLMLTAVGPLALR